MPKNDYRGRQLRNKRSTTLYSGKRTRLIKACHNWQDCRIAIARLICDYPHHHYRSDRLSLHRDYRARQIVLDPREREETFYPQLTENWKIDLWNTTLNA